MNVKHFESSSVCDVQGGEYSDASCPHTKGDGVRDRNIQSGKEIFHSEQYYTLLTVWEISG